MAELSETAWEALFENWESEFLQMAVFVLLTTCLVQKGSPESRRLGVSELADTDPWDFGNDPDMALGVSQATRVTGITTGPCGA